MDKSQVKGYIAARVAKELKNGNVVNLGIGLPTLVPHYLPENVHVTLQSENGIVGADTPNEENMEPVYVTDAGGSPSAVAHGGCFIDSATSFSLIRGGHVDATVLGALQVDQEGNLSNWIIPGKMVPGMGGAMDLVVGAKKVIVAMTHTQKGAPKILKANNLPFTAVKCVTDIITEMAVIKVVQGKGLVLKEYNPELGTKEEAVAAIQAATEAELIVDPDLKPIEV